VINKSIRMNSKGSGSGLIEVLIRHLPGGSKKIYEVLCRNNLYPGGESNVGRQDHKSWRYLNTKAAP
jgi:hypothetical protein